MSPAAGTKLMQDWADFWSAFSTRGKVLVLRKVVA
jgi:hypothetical protein